MRYKTINKKFRKPIYTMMFAIELNSGVREFVNKYGSVVIDYV